ncbi:cyclic di-GMP receptor LapD [Pseudomonas aeruginosa]|uniref:cyclic di-GMP receptor LapD n=1 Tax=Pseudomonas aeruginosa TaxID=287 RepID=UPI002739A1C5|nr:EAL domain-containing protein [Pseudomonas aeruginosa]
MSLLKQLFLAICLFLVVAFSGSFVSSVENSREQLRGQLRSHAQDAATALGLSLTPHVDDPAMVQLMVSSIFDSGYFASIRVIDIKSGKPLVERVQAHAERTVPGWFERLVDLQPQGGDALIMRGWEQAARVEVVSHPQFALARLRDSALGSLYWLLACGAASLLLGGWLLRRQLRPLDQMVRQAHAISRREFLSLPRLPRTPELRRVVQAMNQMVEKLRTLFAEEAARSDKLRAQAYQDSLTGLPNRRLFDARLNEQLGAGEHEHAGQLLLLRLNDLNGLNQRLGGQRTDELIQAVARLLVDSCGQQGRTDWLLARSRGGEFAVLAPGCSREQAERLAEELCEGLENLARTGASDLTPVAYLGISAFAEGDSPADLLARADQALAQAESQPAQPWASQDGTALAALNDSQDWHDWIDQALTERRLLLYFQPVVDCLDTQRVLHHKVLARLLDPQATAIAAGRFLPWIERFGWAARLDLAMLEQSLEHLRRHPRPLALSLSAASVRNAQTFAPLLALLKAHPQEARQLTLELDERHLPAAAELERLSQVLRELGCGLGLQHFGGRFSLIGNLTHLGLAYLKLDGCYLHAVDREGDKRLFIEAVYRTTHSIDLPLIAEQVETLGELEVLREMGLRGAMGRLFGSPAPWSGDA